MKRYILYSLLFLFSLPILAEEKVKDGPYPVIGVVDGDTFKIRMGMGFGSVRLIGVDTPETVHPNKPVQYFGREASAFTKKHLKDQWVYLEYDQNRTDRYGRILAYVYREADGFFLNLELVKQGYGFAYVKYPFSKMDVFIKAQREAQEKGRGLWASRGKSERAPPNKVDDKSNRQEREEQADKGEADHDIIVYITRSGKKYHRDGCRYLSKSKIEMKLKDIASRYGACGVCAPPRPD